MSKLVETIVQALRDSPLYQDNEFVQSEQFVSFTHSVVTQRADCPNLVQSILNHFFELQGEEKAQTRTEPMIATEPSTIDELITLYKDRLFDELADLYVDKKLLEKGQAPAGVSQRSKSNDTSRNEIDSDTEVSKFYEGKTTRKIEESYADLRQQFLSCKDKGKEISKSFPFINSVVFKNLLNEIHNSPEHSLTWQEDAYRVFYTLMNLSLRKAGKVSTASARNLKLIDGCLEQYNKNRKCDAEKGEEPTAVFLLAQKHLRWASDKLKLPDDYFILILNAIADNKEFSDVVHRQSGIVKPQELMGQLFENEFKVGGRAGGSDPTPASEASALNAMAERVLNSVVPKEIIKDHPKIIYDLMKIMGFKPSEASVKRNIERASPEGTDKSQLKTELLGKVEPGSLFQRDTAERVTKHLSEIHKEGGNRD